MAKKVDWVMAFGTFDLIHRGHISYLKKGKALGERLVVVVARDANTLKVKGFRPLNHEKDRLAVVAALEMVDKAVLGDKKDFFAPIEKFKPAVIALGYDQFAKKGELEKKLQKARIKASVKRIKPFNPARYKTRKIKNKMVVFKP
jgi:FAD synthetase